MVEIGFHIIIKIEFNRKYIRGTEAALLYVSKDKDEYVLVFFSPPFRGHFCKQKCPLNGGEKKKEKRLYST